MTAFTTEEKKWVDQIDNPTGNRKARRHPLPKHNKRGFTKTKKKK